MNNGFKNFLKKLALLGVDINYALDSGISLFGLNISKAKFGYADRSAVGLNFARARRPVTVLDVGSGGGEHAKAFAADGASVTCVDFGTSIYAERARPVDGVSVVHADFVKWRNSDVYDVVWASHVLEHQRNPGHFIERLISCCAEHGMVIITVPFPHRRLWGGHVSLWSPGLLAYNIVLCGIDLSSAVIMYGYRETTIAFSPIKVDLPPLTFDNGDLNLLAHLMPNGFREHSDVWI